MAKPLNPYQGGAPAAMAQMGAGVMEAGANAARSLQSGYEALGSGLAKGITSVANAYAQNKEEQARFDATKKMFKAYESYLPESARNEIGGIFEDTSMSTAQKNAMAPMLLNFLAQSQQQYGVSEQQKAAMDRLKYSEGAATGRQAASIEAQKVQPFYNYEAQASSLNSMPINPFSGDQGFGIHSQTPVKQTLGSRHFLGR